MTSGVGGEAAVVARGLVKRFGSTAALDGIDLVIPRGSVYGLIGPNGAGKTTTLALVCGWLGPTAGSLEVLGGPPGDMPRLKGRISALPQDAFLPPRVPVAETLRLYARLQGIDPRVAAAEVERALDQVGMAEWAGRPAGTLSHGMAKRVCLAQALLGAPELMVLDEPTAGLDPASAHRVRTLIGTLPAEATVIISSHDLHELEALCDRAAVLDRGRLVAEGSMAELTASDQAAVIELANPAHELEALAAAALKAPGVASAIPEAPRLVVHFEAQEGEPAARVSAVLRVLLDAGALVVGVSLGQGLERKVLSLQ